MTPDNRTTVKVFQGDADGIKLNERCIFKTLVPFHVSPDESHESTRQAIENEIRSQYGSNFIMLNTGKLSYYKWNKKGAYEEWIFSGVVNPNPVADATNDLVEATNRLVGATNRVGDATWGVAAFTITLAILTGITILIEYNK